MSHISETILGGDAPDTWTAFAFTAEAGDTAFAARQGTVIDVVASRPIPKAGITWTEKRNYLTVEHEDCTRAQYELFEPRGIFPNVGEEVEAGQAIGIIADGSAYPGGTQLRLTIYYSDLTHATVRAGELKEVPQRFINPTFVTAEHDATLKHEANYLVAHPPAAIHQEMSKREIKRWRKRQQSKN